MEKENLESLTRKEGTMLVNELFSRGLNKENLRIKKGILKKTNRKKLQKMIGREAVLVHDNSRYSGKILKKETSFKELTGKRRGYFFESYDPWKIYQIPQKRVIINNNKIQGVFIDMSEINKDTNPANGRFYGIIELKD